MTRDEIINAHPLRQAIEASGVKRRAITVEQTREWLKESGQR